MTEVMERDTGQLESLRVDMASTTPMDHRENHICLLTTSQEDYDQKRKRKTRGKCSKDKMCMCGYVIAAFLTGFIVASAIWLPQILSTHQERNAFSSPDYLKQDSDPIIQAEQNKCDYSKVITQQPTLGFTCNSDCPESCQDNLCILKPNLKKNNCQCLLGCKKGYVSSNTTGKLTCRPACCEPNGGAPFCCPEGTTKVSRQASPTIVCCPLGYPHFHRDVHPGSSSSYVEDLCFDADGSTADYPKDPLICHK